MDDDDLIAVFDAFDELDSACRQVETALPQQMTAAIQKLETARINMSAVLRIQMTKTARKPQ